MDAKAAGQFTSTTLITWFLAGIGLTVGHLFTMWLLRICHLA